MKAFFRILLLFLIIFVIYETKNTSFAREPSSASILRQYNQIFLPPVNVVNSPPVYVGPTYTTYYNPPVYVNNYPPVWLPGPVIIRYPGHPFLRTFIP